MSADETKTSRKKLTPKDGDEANADESVDAGAEETGEAEVPKAPPAAAAAATGAAKTTASATVKEKMITVVSSSAFTLHRTGEPPIEIKKGPNKVPASLKGHYAFKIHKCVEE